MATVILPLVDVRRTRRIYYFSSVPAAGPWRDLYLSLRHRSANDAVLPTWMWWLQYWWGTVTPARWGWDEQRASFCLPAKPPGTYKMEWVTTASQGSFLVSRLGRGFFDLDGWSKVAGKTALRYTESPLWSTWPKGKRIEIVPCRLWPGPAGLPTHAPLTVWYGVVTLSVRYTY